MPIKIINGDAAAVRPSKNGILLLHLCNRHGGWGRGFVLAVNKISLAPQYAYRSWAKEHNNDIPMGIVQFVEAQPGLIVVNMIAQKGMDPSQSSCMVDYDALERCLKISFNRASLLGFDIHIPSGIGSGLAGGDKNKIHSMIKSIANGVEQSAKKELDITLWEYTDTKSDSFVLS